MTTEVMTYEETAQYLRWSRSKLERKVKEGTAPPSILDDGRRTWRKGTVDKWLDGKEREQMMRAQKLRLA